MNGVQSDHYGKLMNRDDDWQVGGGDAPPLFKIRRAKVIDQAAIRSLIRTVGINPLGLDWRRFFVAMDQNDEVIGCGQIKVHRDGSRELASIAVHENWRGLGIAARIIECLLQEGNGTLWLMCRSEMVPFYERFGFNEVIHESDLPPYFQRVTKLWGLLSKASGGKHLGSVMVWKKKSRMSSS